MNDAYRQNPGDINHSQSATKIRFHKRENLELNTKHPLVKIYVGNIDEEDEKEDFKHSLISA
jgi:hypothetical protein